MTALGSIFASTLSGGIGYNGKLPWKIPEDLRHFEKTTSSPSKANRKAVIMGRRTFESLPGPLKNRISLVITSKTDIPHGNSSNVILCKSLADALSKLKAMDIQTAFIAGGAAIYDEAHESRLPDRVYWTRVCGPKLSTDTKVDLDLLLNQYDVVEMSKTRGTKEYTYDFLLLERKRPNGDLPPSHGRSEATLSTEEPTPERDSRGVEVTPGVETSSSSKQRIADDSRSGLESSLLPSTIPCDGDNTLRTSSMSTPLVTLPHALQALRHIGHQEAQYLSIMNDIITTGLDSDDRTGVGTFCKFGAMMRFDLRNSFPLLTTKKVYWKGVVEELLWFLKGDTNAKNLADKKVHVWDANGSKEFLTKRGLGHREEGDLGPVYGFQWRHFGAKYETCHSNYEGQGFDQVMDVINQIKRDPTSRRLIISAWNPAALHEMALPPCHMMCQFFVDPRAGELSCLMFQRSADWGLGVPFNIASYSLLCMIIAKLTGLKAGEFVHCVGNAHVYKNHVEPLREQLTRLPRPFPRVEITGLDEKNDPSGTIKGLEGKHFKLVGYDPWPVIKMDMAV